MKISREGVVLIKSFEGFRPRAVARPEGGWVIGYGHTASAREGLTVGEADAELLLQYDLIPVVKALHERVTAPLNQHQFDALASFAFSLGVERFAASDVLARVNAGASAEAADALFGWPEAPGPDAALRRRAAERALFVAAPGVAVTLADLLAAPLPLPATSAEAEPTPEPPQGDARAAAVAHLLGEVETDAAPVVDAEAPVRAETAPAPAAAPTPTPTPTLDPQLQRYSPYQAAVVGPLPSLEPQRAITAINLSPIAVAPEPIGEAVADGAAVEPANDVIEREVQPEPIAAPVTEIVTETAEAEPTVEETASEPVAEAPEPEPATPVEPMIVEPAAPEPLVLTPLTEAETATEPRPLWTPEQRTFGHTAADEAEPLFDDGGAATLGPILRHEVDEEASRGFDWSETGAFLAMGGIGLVSFGAAMAAFRRAGQEANGGDQTALIGWVLALIALICVGVSTFNLYQKLGRPKAE